MSAYTDDRLTGVWLRVDSGIGRDPRVAQLAKQLNISVATAIGHLVQFWGGVAEHAPNGSLIGVLPDTIELWASWRGRRGRFESVFRPIFVDENGEVRKWHEHNGYHLARAAADKARKRRGRAADKVVDVPQSVRTVSSVPNPTQPNPTTQPPPVGAVQSDGEKPVVDLPAVKALTLALNEAMRANPAITSFNEIPASAGTATVGEWLAAGYPVDLCITTVREVATAFKPKGKDRQIGSLAYFTNAVREAFEASKEARYKYLVGEARRGMNMADTSKYPDWPQHEARYMGRKAATNGAH